MGNKQIAEEYVSLIENGPASIKALEDAVYFIDCGIKDEKTAFQYCICVRDALAKGLNDLKETLTPPDVTAEEIAEFYEVDESSVNSLIDAGLLNLNMLRLDADFREWIKTEKGHSL